MAKIEDRLSSDFSLDGYVSVPNQGYSSGAIPENSMSIEGYVPARGLIPPEFMNDTDMRKLFPGSPYLVRGFVDVNMIIRNTALQALAKK